MVTDSVSPAGESKKKYRDWTFSSVWDKEIQTVYAYDKESARRAKTCLTCYYQKFPVTWFHITKKVSHWQTGSGLYNRPGPYPTILLFHPGELEKAGQWRGSLWSRDLVIPLIKGLIFSSQQQHRPNLRIQVTTKRDYSLFPTFPLILNFPRKIDSSSIFYQDP